MVSDVRFVHSQMNLHLLFSKWASCYFQHWYHSWHLLFHRSQQWESIRRTLQLLSLAILWRQWTQFLIQICTEIAGTTHFFWKYNDLFFFFFRISSKEERQVKRRQRWRRRQRKGQKSGKREHKTTTLFLFQNSIQSFRIQLQKKLPTLNELNEME